jgi:hypothetical protein
VSLDPQRRRKVQHDAAPRRFEVPAPSPSRAPHSGHRRYAQNDAIGPFDLNGPGVQRIAMHLIDEAQDWNKRTFRRRMPVRPVGLPKRFHLRRDAGQLRLDSPSSNRSRRFHTKNELADTPASPQKQAMRSPLLPDQLAPEPLALSACPLFPIAKTLRERDSSRNGLRLTPRVKDGEFFAPPIARRRDWPESVPSSIHPRQARQRQGWTARNEWLPRPAGVPTPAPS